MAERIDWLTALKSFATLSNERRERLVALIRTLPAMGFADLAASIPGIDDEIREWLVCRSHG